MFLWPHILDEIYHENTNKTHLMAKIRDARLPIFASFFAIYYAFTFLFQEKMCPISVRQNQKKCSIVVP